MSDKPQYDWRPDAFGPRGVCHVADDGHETRFRRVGPNAVEVTLAWGKQAVVDNDTAQLILLDQRIIANMNGYGDD